MNERPSREHINSKSGITAKGHISRTFAMATVSSASRSGVTERLPILANVVSWFRSFARCDPPRRASACARGDAGPSK